MITAKDLFAVGYQQFKDPFSQATHCFQKRVWTENPDNNETAYFVNLYYYEFPNGSVSWELNMSFDRGDWKGKFPYCWIKYRVADEATVKDVESMAEAIYIANGGVPYGD